MGTSKTYKQEDNTKPHRLITERLVDDHRGGNKRSQKRLQTNKNKKSESGKKKKGGGGEPKIKTNNQYKIKSGKKMTTKTKGTTTKT